MTSEGSAEIDIQNGNQTRSKNTRWSGEYDGQHGNLDIQTEENGHLKKTHVDFTNEDLANLLKIRSVEIPLHKRLQNDFLYQAQNQEQENIIAQNRTLGQQMLLEMKREEGPTFPLKIVPLRPTMYKYKNNNVKIHTPKHTSKHRPTHIQKHTSSHRPTYIQKHTPKPNKKTIKHKMIILTPRKTHTKKYKVKITNKPKQ